MSYLLILLPVSLAMAPPPPTTGNLRGVVAGEDIYHGPRIEGASVWLESGQSTSTSSSGNYIFYDLPLDTYTVFAVADGYQQGSCAKEVTGGGDHWCSIALLPDTGEPDTGEPDTGEPDTGEPDTGEPDTGEPDTGEPDTGEPDTGEPQSGGLPGDRELLSAHGPCSCGSGRGSLLALPLLPLVLMRRRRLPDALEI